MTSELILNLLFSLLGITCGFFVSRYFFIRSIRSKLLRCYIKKLPSKDLAKQSKEVVSEIEKKYGTSFSVFEILVQNEGKVCILKEDFIHPLVLKYPEQSDLKEIFIVSKSNNLIDVSLIKEESSISILFPFLDANDGFIIRFILNQINSNSINLEGKIKNEASSISAIRLPTFQIVTSSAGDPIRGLIGFFVFPILFAIALICCWFYFLDYFYLIFIDKFINRDISLIVLTFLTIIFLIFVVVGVILIIKNNIPIYKKDISTNWFVEHENTFPIKWKD